MSESRASFPRPSRMWLAVLAVWTVPGVIAAVVYHASSIESGRPITWGQAFLWMLPFWYVWALLTPFVVWLARRFPLEGSSRWRNGLFHAGFAVVFSLVHLVVGLVIVRALIPPSDVLYPLPQAIVRFVRAYFEFEILVYPLVLVATYAFDYHRRSRRDALRAAELEVRLAHARLHALRMQLQPHFLFNTLHAAGSLMDEDVRGARRMLASLSDLLRRTLDTEGAHEVPLEEELETLELYMDIERERFSDRLAVEMDIDPDALDAMVPCLILQPLVENAVRHGIAPRPAGGTVTVTARRADTRLRLEVQDDGEGPPPGAVAPTGVGLANARARLEELYGPAHGFTTGAADGGGFRVEIEIPYRAAGGRIARGDRPEGTP